MDARLRDLLKKARSSGDPLDIENYLLALGRARRVSYADVPFLVRQESAADFDRCSELYYQDQTDLFVDFLRLRHADLSSLLGISGQHILMNLFDTEPAIEPAIRSFLTGMDAAPEDEAWNITTLTRPSLEACERAQADITEAVETLSGLGNEAIRGFEIAPCIALAEALRIFDVVRCVSPTLLSAYQLNWRGRRLGDLAAKITYDFHGAFRLAKACYLTRLGVLLPLWANDILTADDLIYPGTEPMFLIEMTWPGDAEDPEDLDAYYYSVYRKSTEEGVSPFIMDAAHGGGAGAPPNHIGEGQLPNNGIVIERLISWGERGDRIRHAATNVDLSADVVLWLPHSLPTTPVPPIKEKECTACTRLKPYKRRCKKHAGS